MCSLCEKQWNLLLLLFNTVVLSFVLPAIKKMNLLKADGTKKLGSEVLAGKEFICIYFSARWCPECRDFTHVLKDFYQVCILSLK